MATRRLFFAIWLPEAVAGELHRLGCELAREGRGRAMRADTLHLTLAFLGEVDGERLPEFEALGARVAATCPGFPLVFDRIERWDHNRIDWAGASQVPGSLHALASRLREALAMSGLAAEPHAFAPHVTLARNGRPGQGAAPRPIPPLAMTVDELRLVESCRSARGAEYVPLARWPLLIA